MGVSGRSPQRHRPAALEARCRPGRGRPAGRYPGDGAAPVSAPPAARADSYFDAQGLLRAERVRADFPILGREVHGRPLVYLDSAASSQQPRAVLEATEHYATSSHANVHRGVHTLSQEATVAFEAARETVRRFINARKTGEIIFTRGTTEAINLVARSWGGTQLGAGDEVLITHLEHHANIVPWQLVCAAADRRALRTRITAGGDAALAGRRGHDTQRQHRAQHLQCAALEI